MNGSNVMFDTNALINYFNGHSSLQQISNAQVSLSIISIIEFLSCPKITQAEENLLFGFLKKVIVVNLDLDNLALIRQIALLRKQYRIKLPDAIIAAIALITNSALITSNSDFSKIHGLTVLIY